MRELLLTARQPNISITQHQSNQQAECEKHNGVGRQAKLIAGIVDTTTIEALSGSIALNRDGADNNVASAYDDKQDAGPQVVPLWFLDLECLVKLRLLVRTVLLAVDGRWRHAAAVPMVLLLLRRWSWWGSAVSTMLLGRTAITTLLLRRTAISIALLLLRLLHLVSVVVALVVARRFALMRHCCGT